MIGPVSIYLQSLFYREKDRFGIGMGDDESCSATVGFVVWLYCIGQSPSIRDDGDGSIPQGVQLIQSTGFIHTGHQKEVCTPLDQMGQGGVELEYYLQVGKFPGQSGQLFLVLGIPCSQDHYLYFQFSTDRVEVHGSRGKQDPEPFLIHDPANEADEGNARLRSQPYLFLEESLY